MASSKRLDACTAAVLQGPVLNTRLTGFTCRTCRQKPVTTSLFTLRTKQPPDT